MKKAIYPNLFKPMKLNGLRLKNRITMAPLYLGYAASGGTVSPLLLYHYKLIAQSGAAMIVVENACNWSCRESRPFARGGARKSELSIASCFSKNPGPEDQVFYGEIYTRHLNEKNWGFNFLRHPCGFHPWTPACIQ
jgi:hypothetical protein